MIDDFDWDSGKARSNQQKHGVSFRLATTVLRDPMDLTIYHKDHSSEEDLWVTLGRAESGQHLVVIHTWNWIEPAGRKTAANHSAKMAGRTSTLPN